MKKLSLTSKETKQITPSSHGCGLKCDRLCNHIVDQHLSCLFKADEESYDSESCDCIILYFYSPVCIPYNANSVG